MFVHKLKCVCAKEMHSGGEAKPFSWPQTYSVNLKGQFTQIPDLPLVVSQIVLVLFAQF